MTMKASDMEITADSVMNTKAYVDPDKLKDAQMEITVHDHDPGHRL